MKFKVLRGKHNEGGVTYKKGEIVDSATDLTKFNFPPLSVKFEPVLEEASTPVAVGTKEPEKYTEEELKTLSRTELLEIAEDLELDMQGYQKKNDLISLILGE